MTKEEIIKKLKVTLGDLVLEWYETPPQNRDEEDLFTILRAVNLSLKIVEGIEVKEEWKKLKLSGSK